MWGYSGVVMGGTITPDYKHFTRRTELRDRQCYVPEVVVGASAVGFGKGFRGTTDLELAVHCDYFKRSTKRSEPTIQAGQGFSNAVIVLFPITVHHSIFHLHSSCNTKLSLSLTGPPSVDYPPSQHYPRTRTLHSSARKMSLEARIGYSVTTRLPALPESRSFIPSLRHSSLDGRTFTHSSSACKNSQSVGQCLGAFGARAYSVKTVFLCS